MSHIFLSHSRGDRQLAESLAHALEMKGWSVWWDRLIPAGGIISEIIEDEIDNAQCIVVLWSKKSVASRWVRIEAEEGRSRNVLVPVLIEKVKIPLAFRGIQTADLIAWDSQPTAASFVSLVADLARILGPPPLVRLPRQGDHLFQAKTTTDSEAGQPVTGGMS